MGVNLLKKFNSEKTAQVRKKPTGGLSERGTQALRNSV